MSRDCKERKYNNKKKNEKAEKAVDGADQGQQRHGRAHRCADQPQFWPGLRATPQLRPALQRYRQ